MDDWTIAMGDWQVAIPSYRRSEIISQRTLRMLADGGVPRDRIHLFVATQEAAVYVEQVDKGLYGELVPHQCPGDVAGANNAVNDYFEAGKVVHCDDDLDGISEMTDPKTLVRVRDVAAVFDQGFAVARSHGATLWGVYPVHNPYFMRRRVMTKLCFVIGHVYGQVLKGRVGERLTVPVKADYERSLSHFMMDGALARLDWLVAETRVYAGQGGLIGVRSPENVQVAIEILQSRYPGLVRPVKRKSGWDEIRLVHPRA